MKIFVLMKWAESENIEAVLLWSDDRARLEEIAESMEWDDYHKKVAQEEVWRTMKLPILWKTEAPDQRRYRKFVVQEVPRLTP